MAVKQEPVPAKAYQHNNGINVRILTSYRVEHVTFGSAPAALSACGSQGIVFHSTPVSCSPWLCVWGYSPFAPPSSPMPPSAGHNVGRSSVPVYKHSIANAKSRLCNVACAIRQMMPK